MIKFKQYPGSSTVFDPYIVVISFHDWHGCFLWKKIDIYSRDVVDLSKSVMGLWGTTDQPVFDIVERVVFCFNSWRYLRTINKETLSDLLSVVPPLLYPHGTH